MRIRTVKPEFWGHPILAKLTDESRLLAIGLLNIADDEGYFLADPLLIRSSIWPFDDDSTKARRSIDDLSRIGYIFVSKHETHGLIGYVVNFTKHQRVDRPNASKLASYFDSTNVRRLIDDDSTIDRRRIRDQGKEQGKEQVAGSAEGCADVSAPTSNLKKEKIVETDEQWLEGLKANQAYQGINIVAEYGKMVAWCGVNKKQATKRRFINWLNRAEKPLSFTQVGQTESSQYQRSHKVHEPANWREVLRINYPDNVFSNDTRDFQSMSVSQQQSIVDAFNRVPPNERRSA